MDKHLNRLARSYTEDPKYPGPIPLCKTPFIPDDTYALIVEKMAIACTDVAFRPPNEEAIYIACRNVEPMKGEWIIGGRIRADDTTLEDAIARNVKRETGLVIANERFEFVMCNFYTWAKTSQGDFTGRNHSTTYCCVISDEELAIAMANLEKQEYVLGYGLKKFNRKQLELHVQTGGHPALLDIFNNIFRK